jgi:hypothetical protein
VRTLLLLPLLLAGACTYFSGDDRVLVTSTPAGAEILVDGEPTGRTTPSLVELGGMTGGDHSITVVKPGFDPETRKVYHYTTTATSRWIDGATAPEVWNFPLWWTLGDFVLPFAVRWRYVPHELHVRLYREGEGPVSSGFAPARKADS